MEEGRGGSKKAGKIEENLFFRGGTDTPCIKQGHALSFFQPAFAKETAEFLHSRPVLPGKTVQKIAAPKKKNLFFIFGPPVQTGTGPRTEYEIHLDRGPDRLASDRSGPTRSSVWSGSGPNNFHLYPLYMRIYAFIRVYTRICFIYA